MVCELEVFLLDAMLSNTAANEKTVRMGQKILREQEQVSASFH